MAISEEAGEFGYSITSSTFSNRQEGGTEVVINVEGNASGFGQLNGTLTMIAPAPGADAGPVNFTGAAFLDSGEVIGTTAEGCWQKLDGEQKWRVRGINMNTQGGVFVSDGTLDLATRSFNGTFSEWT
jgi:hypothetical protein